jgi:transposase InsO family protein
MTDQRREWEAKKDDMQSRTRPEMSATCMGAPVRSPKNPSLVHTRTWPTRQAARTAIYEYLEVFYNRRRRHSALGYLSPTEYERRYQQHPATLVTVA